MKKLYLLRHADASKFSSSNDKERVVTAKGLAEIRLLTKLLKDKKFVCDLVLCSSSVRTMQTWDELSKNGGYKFHFKSLEALYNPDLSTFVEVVSNIDSSVESVLIISHNPTLSEFTTFLSAYGSVVPFSTCTMKHLTLDIQEWKDLHKGCGTLEWEYNTMRTINISETQIIGSDPNLNVWISASAGSGKTKILVDRFLRLLLQGVNPTKILCITFTKSAASEMIARITSELGEWAVCESSELERRLFNLMQLESNEKFARTLFAKFLDEQSNLKIQTIHSFCQDLLKKFPYAANINNDFRVLDEYDRTQIISNVKKEVFANLEEDDLLGSAGEYSVDKLIEEVLSLDSFECEFLYDKTKAEEYIQSLKAAMGINDVDVDTLFEGFVLALKNSTHLLTHDLDICQYVKAYVSLDRNEQIKQLEHIVDLFITKDNKPRITLFSGQNSLPDVLGALRSIQDIILNYKEQLVSRKLLESTKSFIDFAHVFNSVFSRIKNECNSVDYNDLINITLSLLMNQWIKYKLSFQIEHILVDESQDISIKQWKIIHSLVSDFFSPDNNKTLFVVGDLKQSIYSFQGASPEIFRGMNNVVCDLMNSSGKTLHNIELHESFRSDMKILEFVDSVFSRLGATNSHFSKLTGNATVEIWPLVVEQKTQDEDRSAWVVKTDYDIPTSPEKILAETIAIKVKNLLDSGDFRPRDIMVLFRKRGELFDNMVSAFKSLGIHANGVDRLAFKHNLAIQDLLSIARFILLPEDDYNLACLIKSPVLGLSEGDLFNVCKREDGVSVWQNLCTSQREAFVFLSSILNNKNIHSPYSLFAHVLNNMGVRTKFLARFGLYIDDVIDQFLDIALKFESDDLSLSNFVYFCDNLDIEMKVNLDTHKDEVKIMTVHASKGLQAKLVILPDTTSVPRNSSRILFDPKRGVVLYKDEAEGVNSFYRNLSEVIKSQSMQEYYRLLYVALTRSSNHLIICGASDNEKISESCWYSMLLNAKATQSEKV